MTGRRSEEHAGDGERPTREPALVVGLGASAGGLEPLQTILSGVPKGAGLALVVVQHLDPGHPSMLAELLARHTALKVVEARDGQRPRADHVYVIGPGTQLALEAGVLRTTASQEPTGSLPIDGFFRSLAEDRGERSCGVLLSGAGHDGMAGLRAIKEGGGLTLAQSPETAQHPSMPLSAIEAGLVDHVLQLAEMPAKLLAHAAAVAAGASAASQDAELEASLGRVCGLIHQHTGHDFSRYKTGTLLRRIRRRMQIQHASLDEYLRLLETATGEREALLKDLLIGVTHFFRDPEAFRALAQQVVPRLVQGKPKDAPLRIWVAGCASGEEAYSIAILVREHLERLETSRFVQIFATDLDSQLLAEARQGRYSAAIREHVSPERLDRFFVRDAETYQAAEELREMCIFSEHSLIRDPPFSQLDLVSCRNVLIYLDGELQKRLVPLFHYALRPGGFLFLGPSEGIAGNPELFVAEDQQNRLFRRRETLHRPLVEFPLVGRSAGRLAPAPPPAALPRDPAAATAQQRVALAFERTLRDEYTFPSAVVDERGQALFVAGPVNRYLQLPAGPVTTPNLFESFREGLRHELRSAVHAARTQHRKIVRDGVRVEIDELPRSLRLIVRPLPAVEAEAGLFLVVVQELAGLPPLDADASETSVEPPVVEQLEHELRSTRAELETTVENLESTNEELKSANEELISTNEELQSANEEMQTSREELQSLNEELETVNAELRQKVDELAGANSDLQNLFAATEIATIFLDRWLRVVKFTPAATKLVRLIDADVGRPLADLETRVAGRDLVADARQVLRTLRPIERELQLPGGAWFVQRVLPYRTTEGAVTGVAITFVDISEVRGAQDEARRLAQLVHLAHDAIVVWRFQGGIEYWNRGAAELYGFSSEEALGRVTHQLLKTVFPRPPQEIEVELRSAGRWTGEIVHTTRDGRRLTVLGNLQLIRGEDGVERVLEANRDISERKQAEARQAWLASFPERNPLPIVEVERSGRLHYVNPAAQRLFPDLAADPLAHPWLADWPAVVRELEQRSLFERTVAVGERTYHQSISSLDDGSRLRIYGLDVTARKRAEDASARLGAELGERLGELQAILDSVPVAIWIAHDRECRQITGNSYASQLVMRTTRDANISRSAVPGDAAVSYKVFRDGVELAADELPAQRAATTGQPVASDEMELRFGDGRRIDMILGAVPLLDAAGRPRGSVTAGIDISAQTLAERKLRESESRHRLLAETMLQGVVHQDAAGTIISMNSAAERILGKTRQDFLGSSSVGEEHDTIREDGTPFPGLEHPAMVALRTGEPVRDVVMGVFNPRQNRYRWIRVDAVPLVRPGEAQRPYEVYTVFADISERRQAERALAESEAKYRTLFQSMTEEVHFWRLVRDEQGRILSWRLVDANPPTLRTWGKSLDEIQGKTTDEIFGPGATEHYRPIVEKIMAEGSPHSYEDYFPNLDRHFRFTSIPLGEHFITTGADITVIKKMLKQTEEQRARLETANRQLAEADRRKNEFLAVLSHELRNPLTPIRNSLYILERAAPGSEQALRAREVMSRQTTQLARLVDDLLDVTRVSRNKFQLQRHALDWNDLVRRTLEDYRSLFEAKGIAVEASIPDQPLPIDGDEARLAQVVGNILQNAAKFTPRDGRVSVGTRIALPRRRAVLRVADDGAGMEPEMLRRLFQPFMQGDTTLDRSRGGLGLGLALVKGIVEMHGGEVCAHSEGPGLGAEFVVELPLDESPGAQPDPAPLVAGRRSRRVLIIEDNVDAADSLSEGLQLAGHVVEVAYDGPSGLAKAREFQPECVLCDIGLPLMDGFEVARAFRADQAFEGVALVALSGYALPEDLQRAAQAGFHRHLAKPPDLNALVALLAELPG